MDKKGQSGVAIIALFFLLVVTAGIMSSSGKLRYQINTEIYPSSNLSISQVRSSAIEVYSYGHLLQDHKLNRSYTSQERDEVYKILLDSGLLKQVMNRCSPELSGPFGSYSRIFTDCELPEITIESKILTANTLLKQIQDELNSKLVQNLMKEIIASNHVSQTTFYQTNTGATPQNTVPPSVFAACDLNGLNKQQCLALFGAR